MSMGMAKPMPGRVRGDRRVDADDGAGGVGERPARVARVDGRVGLDQVVDPRAVVRPAMARPLPDTMPLVTEKE